MNDNLKEIKEKIYDPFEFAVSNHTVEVESKEYDACRFELNGLNIVSRSAKTTPKKVGQFVTFWKRFGNGSIEPLNEKDPIDFFIVNVRSENRFGHFVFPKSVLINQGIISTNKKEGKRAFRVYPSWDQVQNKQAIKTQKWQLDYFLEIDEKINLARARKLYSTG